MENKPLVFTEITVQGPEGPNSPGLRTWMLCPFGPTPLLQAMWSPIAKTLICQWDSIKENMMRVPVQQGKKEVPQERKVAQYYIMNISDPKAIQAILDNFVVNYDGQEWQYEYEDARTDQLTTPKEELEKVS